MWGSSDDLILTGAGDSVFCASFCAAVEPVWAGAEQPLIASANELAMPMMARVLFMEIPSFDIRHRYCYCGKDWIPQLPTESAVLSTNGTTDLPLSSVHIAACVLGRIISVYRKGDRGADGGTVDEFVVAGNDLALLVAQDGR